MHSDDCAFPGTTTMIPSMEPKRPQGDLPEEFARLADRFWEIATREENPSEALSQLSVALNALVAEIPTGTLSQERLRRALHLLDSLAAVFEEAPKIAVTSDQTPTLDIDLRSSLGHFMEAFHTEARRRLASLSLSLMDAFNGNEEAVRQSMGHLRSIKSGAQIVQLGSIAALAESMEELMAALSSLPNVEWPVRLFLRGYSVLEAALDKPSNEHAEILEQMTKELWAVNPNSDVTGSALRAEKRRASILVVEPSQPLAASITYRLSKHPFDIRLASSADEASELLGTGLFHVLITDLDVPGVDGLSLARSAAADPNLAKLKVIVLTAEASEFERVHAALPAARCLAKSDAQSPRLLEVLDEILQ